MSNAKLFKVRMLETTNWKLFFSNMQHFYSPEDTAQNGGRIASLSFAENTKKPELRTVREWEIVGFIIAIQRMRSHDVSINYQKLYTCA